MFDTHAHLNFKDFEDDYKEIIKDCNEKNIKVINVGTDLESSQKAVEIAKKHKGVYAAIGIHPLNAEKESNLKKIEEIAKSDQVVAIGEIGLDKAKEKTFSAQKELFKKQINIAQNLNLPIILHSRKAHDETLEILENCKDQKGVIHCFTGNNTQLKKYLDLGCYIGLNGIIFKLNLNRQIKNTPLDKILIETDCPYLAPPQTEGKNTPLKIKFIAQKVAEIKEVSIEELEEKTDRNAEKLFN
jgi:TatD DNase family protein